MKFEDGIFCSQIFLKKIKKQQKIKHTHDKKHKIPKKRQVMQGTHDIHKKICMARVRTMRNTEIISASSSFFRYGCFHPQHINHTRL